MKTKKDKPNHEVYQNLKTTGTYPDGIEVSPPVMIEEPPSSGIGRIYKEKKK